MGIDGDRGEERGRVWGETGYVGVLWGGGKGYCGERRGWGNGVKKIMWGYCGDGEKGYCGEGEKGEGYWGERGYVWVLGEWERGVLWG